jgi:hypothetical protein
LDGSRTFDGYFNNAAILVGIVAYTDTGTYYTAAVQADFITDDAWTDKDLSGSIPTGAGKTAILSISRNNKYFTVRPNGFTDASWDESTRGLAMGADMGFLVGLDAASIFEYYIDSTHPDPSCWIRGYSTDFTWLTAITDVTPGTNGSWQTVTASSVPDGATAAVVLLRGIYGTDGSVALSVQPVGSSDDTILPKISQWSAGRCYTVLPLNGSKQFRVYTGDKDYAKVYVLGYIAGAGAPADTGKFFQLF